jgi:Tol biopolymer transport system component
VRLSASRAPRFPILPVLAVIGLLAGLALAAFFSLPRLMAFYPANGAQYVSSRSPIRLTFSRPMDQTSVENALHFTPGASGAFEWDAARRTLTFTPREPWPVDAIITATLNGGRSRSRLPLLGQHSWTFTITGARIAYLTGAPPNLWFLPLAENAAPQAITSEPVGVYDFDLSPDGLRLIYSALREDGGADLRSINIAVRSSHLQGVDGSGAVDVQSCPGEACLSPAFSPDGKRVAYERHTLTPGLGNETSFAEGQVHVYTLATGADDLVGDPETLSRFPRWGPDGRLSYFDINRQAIVIQDLATGAVTYIPDSSGEMGTWSPDGQYIVYPEIFLLPEPTPNPGAPESEHTEKFFSHLLQVTIATNAVENLSGEGVVEDASPVYSPSGVWLAFARKGLDPTQWTPGRQLWLMRANGSDAHALTAEPLYNHSAFVWTPDERALIYMRHNAATPGLPAEIWMINADGTGARKLVSGGYLPAWLP